MIEDSIFKQYTPCFAKLENYGFVKNEGRYSFKTCFFQEQFEAVIEISAQGAVQGRVFDIASNEEYALLNVENWQGTFVNEVRSAYKEILLDIRDTCFLKNYFIFPQSNRIAGFIKEKYADEPCFLWENYPNYGVFKNPETNKWYAAILNIDHAKIDKNKSGEIEIIDIKADPKNVQELLLQVGFYPAYHMNKKSWLTIILDNSLSDERIMELIAKSHTFTVKKSRAKK